MVFKTLNEVVSEIREHPDITTDQLRSKTPITHRLEELLLDTLKYLINSPVLLACDENSVNWHRVEFSIEIKEKYETDRLIECLRDISGIPIKKY